MILQLCCHDNKKPKTVKKKRKKELYSSNSTRVQTENELKCFYEIICLTFQLLNPLKIGPKCLTICLF